MFSFKPAVGILAPGQFRRVRGEKRDKITVCCPGCEGEYQLPRHYLVGAEGQINPILRCPLTGCGWVKQARLA